MILRAFISILVYGLYENRQRPPLIGLPLSRQISNPHSKENPDGAPELVGVDPGGEEKPISGFPCRQNPVSKDFSVDNNSIL
jgi:hypothetical protein